MNGGIGRITVHVQNGVVVLDGHVESAATANKIGELAGSVPGFSDVGNSLDHPAERSGRRPMPKLRRSR